MIRTTRSSSGRTYIALLVVVALLTVIPVGSTRHLPAGPMQQPTPTEKTPRKENGDLGSWTLESIGSASEGEARRKSPEIQLHGASDGFGQTRDSLHFLSQPSEGNFEMSARLDAIDANGLGGLMVRLPGRYGGELYFRVTAHRAGDGNVQLRTAYRSREKRNEYESTDKSAVVALPVYLKLRRAGSILSAEFSSDGRGYRELLKFDGKGTGLAARELNVGMVQSSENIKVAATARFKAVRLLSTEPRSSELVSVGVKEPLVGGVPASGAIVRSMPSGPSSGYEDVAYLKSDSAYLKVPKKVTFSRDQATASFEVKPKSVKKPTTANLTVLLNGKKKTVKVNLMPQEAIGSVSMRPGRFSTADPRAIVTVNLVHPAPRGGTKVLVSSSSPKVRTPNVVIVPMGEQSIQFDVSGTGLTSNNNFVTVNSGRVSRDVLVDLSNAGVAVGGVLDCPLFPVTPDIATDGQRVYLNGVVEDGARVFLSGYRYNDSAPTRAFPQGEGRERIYCGCQRAGLEEIPDFDGGVSGTRPYIVVPMNAPSGDYSVEVRSKEGDCLTGGIRSDVCPTGLCSTASNLFVAPSYIVNRLNRMAINANAEDTVNNPPEMSFTFNSFSGKPITEGDNATAMVNFAGIYPGGAKGSGHLTNPDATQAFPQIPLFIGSESRMLNIECREECASLPAGREAECISICEDFVAQGRFTNQFEFTFGGAEFDSSPSKWWGYVAGAGAFALGCYLGTQVAPGHPKAGCIGTGTTLGKVTSDTINDALKDDDDNLGTFSETYTHAGIGGDEWGSATEEQAHKLTVGRDKGDIDLFVQNFRMGGPQILSYSVKLKSLTVVQGYEEEDCEEPNEVFLYSTAFLYQGGPMPAATRFPSHNGTWLLNTGQTENFGGVPLVLEQKTFRPETAAESPLLYIEFGVWEDDEDKDSMGLYSETISLSDFLSRGFSEVVDEISPEGMFIRRAKQQRFATMHGYAGSDDHCYGISAVAGDPNAEEGRVNLEYEIEVTWLKRTRR